jgi:hypothetical protein
MHILDAKTDRALKRLLDYLDCERRDYESRPEPERTGHIYESVELVRAWVKGRSQIFHAVK